MSQERTSSTKKSVPATYDRKKTTFHERSVVLRSNLSKTPSTLRSESEKHQRKISEYMERSASRTARPTKTTSMPRSGTTKNSIETSENKELSTISVTNVLKLHFNTITQTQQFKNKQALKLNQKIEGNNYNLFRSIQQNYGIKKKMRKASENKAMDSYKYKFLILRKKRGPCFDRTSKKNENDVKHDKYS